MLDSMRLALTIVLVTSLCWAQNSSSRQLFDQALAAQQRGDLAAAVRDYEKVLKLEPNLVAARTNLAAAFLQLGQLNEAADNYRAALQQQPGDPHIAVLLGNCLVLRGSYDEAIQLLSAAGKAHPENLDVAFILGEALIHAGRLREGLKFAQKVAAARNDADAWMLAGMTELKLMEFSQARDSLEKGLRLDPAMPGAYTLLGVAKMRTGDEEGAKTAFRKTLESDPNDAEACMRLGTVLRSEGDLDSAKTYLARALQLNPQSPMARYLMAVTETAAGEDAQAAAELEALVRQWPNLLKPHIQLAAIYYRLHREQEGLQERKIVDELLADPNKQDRQLEADPTLDTNVSPVSAAPSH